MKLSIKLSIEAIKSFFLDLVFPVSCLNCRKLQTNQSPEKYLCQECFQKISPKTELECAFCSSRSQNGKTCLFCRQDHSLDYLWSAASYENSIVKKLIWTYKYNFVPGIKTPLLRLLAKFIKQKRIDKIFENYRKEILVTAVPLHPLRLNWRSYNQSELLAQELAQKFNLEVNFLTLKKSSNTKPQAEIENKSERIKNAQGVFACSNPEKIKGKTIILVDDVTTTGSTLDQCAEVLKKSGAEKVIGLVVAKG